MNREVRVGVVGLWHLGCVLCAAWSRLGHPVQGVDFSKKIVRDLQNGIPPIFEPGLEAELKKNIGKNLSFSEAPKNLSECDFVFLAYDTPVKDNDESDTSVLRQAVLKIRGFLKDGSVVIVSSQAPVGFCRVLRKILKEKNPTLELVYSPENLRLGEAIDCYLNPGRIVVGYESEEAYQKVKVLFRGIPAEVIAMSLESAEMAKHAINSFLAASITFSNHLADLCEAASADIFHVVKAMKSDPRIGPKAYLAAGIGFSGGTLGRDLRVLDALNTRHRLHADLFGKIHRDNALRKEALIQKAGKILKNSFHGKKIGILGATYKPGTSTLRRSLPFEIVRQLGRKGASVELFDPKADFSEVEIPRFLNIAKKAQAVFHKSELVILLTEWPQFRELDWKRAVSRMARPNFFDAKNFLADLNLKSFAFNYYGVERS